MHCRLRGGGSAASKLKAVRAISEATAKTQRLSDGPDGVKVGELIVPVECLAMAESKEERQEQAEIKADAMGLLDATEASELPTEMRFGLVVSTHSGGGSGPRGYGWEQQYYVLEEVPSVASGSTPPARPPSLFPAGSMRERLKLCEVKGVERRRDPDHMLVTKARPKVAMDKRLTLAGTRLAAAGAFDRGEEQLFTTEATAWSDDVTLALADCPYHKHFTTILKRAFEAGETVIVERKETEITVTVKHASGQLSTSSAGSADGW